MDSSFSYGYNQLAWVYLETGRYAEAEALLLQTLKRFPRQGTPRKHMGTLKLRTGQPEEAHRLFSHVIALRPDYYGGYLGMAYLKTAQLVDSTSDSEAITREALEWVKQAMSKDVPLVELEQDKDLAALRGLPAWKELIQTKYPAER
jgi:tetratricopeptide (TPR) repeat protein